MSTIAVARRRLKRILWAAGVVCLPMGGAFVFDGCSWWDGSDTFGASVPPLAPCSGPIAASIVAFPAASASGPNSVALGGTLSGCAIFGATIYGGINVTPANSSYASWTANVPLTTFQASTGGQACPDGGANVPLEVLVAGDGGLNAWEGVDAGCVSPATANCTQPTVTVTAAYASADAATPNVLLAGTTNGANICPVTGVTVGGAFSATPIGTSYGEWTATVPQTVFDSWPPCTPPAQGSVSVPVQLLIPNTVGISEPVDAAGCVGLQGN